MQTPIHLTIGRRPDFDAKLAEAGFEPLNRREIQTLQINVGKRCNQACLHCHVDAGPNRPEVMSETTANRIAELLIASNGIQTVDFTGGAPELNPSFRSLVKISRSLGKKVLVRCNLTVLFTEGQEDLPEFFAEQDVELVCSLPCYGKDNVDRQRGKGVFLESLEALKRLNGLGFGKTGSGRILDLVYNPVGPTLPPAQDQLEQDYKRELKEQFGIEFNRLFTITNMPIARFAADLHRQGRMIEYVDLLIQHFNPATVPGLMCRTLLSVSWDGKFYDCDFNQMLNLVLRGKLNKPLTVWDIPSFSEIQNRRIQTAPHCFGCTAGAGSSCGGALL